MTSLISPLWQYLRAHRWLYMFVVVLFFLRLPLITTGHLYDLDERRYNHALEVVEARHDPIRASSYLFQADGRPGYVLFSVVPAVFQKTAEKLGWADPGRLSYYDIPSFFNLLVGLAGSVIFYHLLLLISKEQRTALVGVIVYSLLCNTYMYVRHLLPYDLATVLLLLAAYLLLRKKRQGELAARPAAIAGMLVALAHTVYPGYYLFAVCIGVWIVLWGNFRPRIWLPYILSGGVVITLFEGLSRLSGQSYLQNSLLLSGTIDYGSFRESFAFLPKYLIYVEGPVGYLLLPLCLGYLIFRLPREDKIVKPIFISITLAYLLHAGLGYFFHVFVFYGRLLHAYFPFVVMMAALALELVQPPSWKDAAQAITVIAALISFTMVGGEYSQIVYPRDFEEAYLSRFANKDIYRLLENEPPGEFIGGRHQVFAVNVKKLYPITAEPYTCPVPEGMRLLASAPHSLNFPGYQYDNYSIEMRQWIDERDLKMEIYWYPQAYREQ